MKKELLFIVGSLVVGYSYTYADFVPLVTMSPNDTYTFTWQTCPTDKKPITSYITNIIHNPNNAILTKTEMKQTANGCTNYTFTITTKNASASTLFTAKNGRLGSFDVSATYGVDPNVTKVATIVIKSEKSKTNTTTEPKATSCNKPREDACFAALPLSIPSSTTQPMMLSTSTSGITYTLDLASYKGTKKDIQLKLVPNKPDEKGTTYTLATKNALIGSSFLINQVENGVKTPAYQVIVTEGKQ